MSIELFEHNKTAYESAVAMLSETGSEYGNLNIMRNYITDDGIKLHRKQDMPMGN